MTIPSMVMPLVVGDGVQHVYADLTEGPEKPNR